MHRELTGWQTVRDWDTGESDEGRADKDVKPTTKDKMKWKLHSYCDKTFKKQENSDKIQVEIKTQPSR